MTLKQLDKVDGDSADDARTEAIRSLCQGPAFLQHPSQIGVPDATLQAFGLDDEDLFVTLLERSLDLLVDGPHKEAMLWALGSYAAHATLTERRNDLLTKRDISYRTLVRHEQDGAAKLAALMMKIKDREVAREPASPAHLQYLQQRVGDLEMVVSRLAGFTDKLLELLAEGKPLEAEALRKGMEWSTRQVDEETTRQFEDASTRIFDRAFNLEMNVRDGQEG
ncbi:hypothetical protein [Arthrobacter sp. AL12]|uniref:hypothetical protein n=1 Tax=Arthrobacter sp. AL12 TaxID=3042241 RepID=UPI00249AF76D|nr:hypothetical protein [Arthrobacter sp. AL12]MDI3211747.1 hypothetical protein [Arthrobacter sp. AL12]